MHNYVTVQGNFNHLHFFAESHSLFFENIISSERMLMPEKTMGEVNYITHIALLQEGVETFVIPGSDSSGGSFRICINHLE